MYVMALAGARTMLLFKLLISKSTSTVTVDKELIYSLKVELQVYIDKDQYATAKKITYRSQVVATQAGKLVATRTWKAASLIAQVAIAQLWL